MQPPGLQLEFRWRAESGGTIVGLPRTTAGTPYFPNQYGRSWVSFKHDAATVEAVHRRIELIFRNRETDTWQAAVRSAYDFRRSVVPIPTVMVHILQMNLLRKSVWSIINDGALKGSDLSIISPGCRLYDQGYAGLLTTDIQLWSIIHTLSDVDPRKLSMASNRTATTPELKKMVKDALCSDNYFKASPTELAEGRFILPRHAPYEGPLEMESIVKFLKDTIGMTAYMAQAHFRPFLRRAFDTSPDDPRQEFSPLILTPGEVVAPLLNEELPDFPSGQGWTPNRGPVKRLRNLSNMNKESLGVNTTITTVPVFSVGAPANALSAPHGQRAPYTFVRGELHPPFLGRYGHGGS